MVLDFLNDGIVFLRTIPASGLRGFGVIFIMFAVYILYSAAQGKGSLFSAAPVEMAVRRAKAVPDIHLDKPLNTVRLESAGLLQKLYFIYGGLFLVLGALTLANLLDGLFFYLSLFVILIIVVALWGLYYKRFKPDIQALNRQFREYKSQNKKGL